jgi:hypothetical protein
MRNFVRARYHRSPSRSEVTGATSSKLTNTKTRRVRPCAAGGIWVNAIEDPELALCDWRLVGAMQKTSGTDRCKKTGTNGRSRM